MKAKHLAPLALFIGLSIFLVVQYFRGMQNSAAQEKQAACLAFDGQPQDQQPAPDFELTDLQGKKQRLSQYRGKVILLNFWATWCPPCVEELPSLVKLAATVNPNELAVITVSVDENAQVIKDFMSRTKQNLSVLPVWLDPTKKIPESFGTTKFPETFLIDPQGKIRYKFIYKRDWISPEARFCLRSIH